MGNNIDYVRRSRFNSRAEELKLNNNSQEIMNELIENLGADIQFYQCFKLESEESELIINYNKKILETFANKKDLGKIKEIFNKMIKEAQCEKFIAVGHILDSMFSMDKENAKLIREYLIFLIIEEVLDSEDIKHG